MSKAELRKKAGLSSATFTRLRKNEDVEQAIEAAFSEAYKGDNLVVPRELLSDAFRMAGVA